MRAIVQLSHGMVEFIDRYKPLAEYLAARGILVTGHDHLGHGGSIRTKADYGYFAQPDGNRAVLDDLHAMTVLTKTLYPDVPYFLLGHSMGSFYARQYLCEWGSELSGAIIMGTGFQPKALVQLAKTICRVLAVFFGWQHRSKLVASLSFTGYNKGLEGRTPQDWLNRDAAEVDKYRADERCMFTFTLNAYYSMFTGILRLYDPAVLARMPKDLPCFSWPATPDPVGEQGKGVQRAIDSLKAAGAQNIQKKLYPGAPRAADGAQPAGGHGRHCPLAGSSAAALTAISHTRRNPPLQFHRCKGGFFLPYGSPPHCVQQDPPPPGRSLPARWSPRRPPLPGYPWQGPAGSPGHRRSHGSPRPAPARSWGRATLSVPPAKRGHSQQTAR